ncbi:MAG TPA: hypothetical protein VHL77_13125 [Ferruginibacter sp.]|jgi:hypothetical protein|nr:hypothetical protein [Ferruginibacter sp.]
MKNLIILGFLVLCLVIAQFAQGQTVDEVINRHIEALGGKEKINAIQNRLMEGTLNYQGNDIALSFTQVHNKLNRQDINVGSMAGFNLLADKDGWDYMPFFGQQKPEPRPAEEVKLNQADLDLAGPLVDYVAKGHKTELVGKETIDGKNTYHIKLTTANGKVIQFYLDATTYLITRAVEKKKMNGQEVDSQVDYADYKDVEGVKMPFSMTNAYGTIYISGIKVNQAIPESAFKHDM